MSERVIRDSRPLFDVVASPVQIYRQSTSGLDKALALLMSEPKFRTIGFVVVSVDFVEGFSGFFDLVRVQKY